MKREEKLLVVTLLRHASETLEEDPTGEQSFPGWDEVESPRGNSIVLVARAIAAEGLTPDGSSQVGTREVGCLVRYIADLLEAEVD